MFGEFEEFETNVLLDRGYVILEGIARKSYDSAWETVRKIDGKIYHAGKDPYGKNFDNSYDDFEKWYDATK